jgi:hypothetical protein
MKALFLWLSAIVALLLLYVFTRLSEQSLAMLMGIVFGCLGAIPVAIIVFFAARSNRHEERPAPPAAPTGWQPPVVILTAGQPPQLTAGQAADGYYLQSGQVRTDAPALPVRGEQGKVRTLDGEDF